MKKINSIISNIGCCVIVYDANANKVRRVKISVPHKPTEYINIICTRAHAYVRTEIKGKTIFEMYINNVEKVDFWLRQNIVLKKFVKG